MDREDRVGTFKATAVVATVLVGAVLYVAREVLIPFALALLLSFLLAPLVTRIRHWGVPRVPAVVIVVTLAAAIIAAIAWLVSVQLYDLADKLPNYQATIQQKLKAIKPDGGPFRRTSQMIKATGQELSKPADQAAPEMPTNEGEKPIPVEIHAPKPNSVQVVQRVLGTVLNPLLTVGIVAVFVIFMLIYLEDMRNRFLRLVGMSQINVTTQALDDAASRVSRFLLMNLVVNVTYGIPIGIGLYFIGVPNAVLWGLMATLLRFIPYVGPWIAAAFPIALAFAVDPGWLMLILTILLFIGIELLSNNVIEPWLYGTSTGLSPITVIVAAVFWTWLWGPVGLLLSTPLTVCLAVIGRHFPQLDFFYILLADEPVLNLETRFYQRLVARDPEEAAELAEDFLKDRPLVALYDEVVLPALSMVEMGRRRGTLHELKQRYIWTNARSLIEGLADHVDKSSEAESPDGDTDAKQVSAPATPSVVCIPARADADELAACIVAQLLRRRGIGARAVSAHALTAESLEELRNEHLQVVCICTIAPAAWRHARYLCKRVRSHFPRLKIIALTCGAEEDPADIQQRIGLAPSDIVVKTIGHAVDQAGLLGSNGASTDVRQEKEHAAVGR
ncbi:MAG: AI-2E family transporter [Verrucomicrobia subdivision 3 bacterium]|nr:AI-2E family transporter [Limisphaerales bacterium]